MLQGWLSDAVAKRATEIRYGRAVVARADRAAAAEAAKPAAAAGPDTLVDTFKAAASNCTGEMFGEAAAVKPVEQTQKPLVYASTSPAVVVAHALDDVGDCLVTLTNHGDGSLWRNAVRNAIRSLRDAVQACVEVRR